MNANTIRQTCKRMADDGQLRIGSNGTYHPPGLPDTGGPEEPVALTTPSTVVMSGEARIDHQ
jgi:hypothetical protein